MNDQPDPTAISNLKFEIGDASSNQPTRRDILRGTLATASITMLPELEMQAEKGIKIFDGNNFSV